MVNFKEHHDQLIFIPLGGCNEIGINLNVYGYKGKYIVVDCGAGFPDENVPGVDVVVADISFLKNIKSDIIAMIITHIHQDHLGAVQFLWPEIECPIYTTSFTATLLKLKLSEYNLVKKVKIITVTAGQKLHIEPFEIEMAPLTHSTPEMQALMIRTAAGNVLHTGDWKFDHDPVVGHPGDEALLKRFGDEGITALVCDSTNVFNQQKSGSEGELRKSLVDIVAGCPKLVVVATFASNIARLDTLLFAAKKAGRKVIFAGRSLHNLFAAAQENGYLMDCPTIIEESDFKRYQREELMIISTGCQGEPLAAITKMVDKVHNNIELKHSDTVIFSSKIIPGNEKRIFRLFNILIKDGVEVITERDHFVHVSGHPSVEELKHMYDLVRPEIVIPVHGEAIHLHEHCKIAKKHGIKHTIEISNGDVSVIDKHSPKVIGKVRNGYQVVDGNNMISSESRIFKTRKLMNSEGIAIITIFVGKGKLLSRPVVNLPGIIDREENFESYTNLVKLISEDLRGENTLLANGSYRDIEQKVRGLVKRYLREETGKTPRIFVNVERVNY
ncbi:MAG: ribonuclease J [Rickettsiaceae bacterium]|nr:ribonuclease J [Rickettsiaceae bacterium]